MKIEEVISQLESLIEDRKSFLSNDGDDETFRNDIEALEAAIDILHKKLKIQRLQERLER